MDSIVLKPCAKRAAYAILIGLLLITFISCKKEIHKEYYPDGSLWQVGEMRNNKFHGDFKGYYQNGDLQMKGEFINGEMVGKWEYFYKNGKPMSIEIRGSKSKVINFNYWDSTGLQLVKDGNGKILEYYPSGQLKRRATFVKSQIEGKHETWFENGQIENEFYYKNGLPTGTWKYWDEQGKLIQTEQFP